MTPLHISPDDPRLTAYVLEELTPVERTEVELLLATSPEAQAAVDEIRGLTTQLFTGLQTELKQQTRATVRPHVLRQKSTGAAGPAVSMPPRQNRFSQTAASRSWGIATIAAGVLLMLGVSFLSPPSDTGVQPSQMGHVAADGSYHLALSDFVNVWEAEQQLEWEMFIASLTDEERHYLFADNYDVASSELSEAIDAPSGGTTASPGLEPGQNVPIRTVHGLIAPDHFSVHLDSPVAGKNLTTSSERLSRFLSSTSGPEQPNSQTANRRLSELNQQLNKVGTELFERSSQREMQELGRMRGRISGNSTRHPAIPVTNERHGSNASRRYESSWARQTIPLQTSSYYRVITGARELGESIHNSPGFDSFHEAKPEPLAENRNKFLFSIEGRLPNSGVHNETPLHSELTVLPSDDMFARRNLNRESESIGMLAHEVNGVAAVPVVAMRQLNWDKGVWRLRLDVDGDHIYHAADPRSGESYRPITENDFIVPTGETALSTFGLDVDTASYSNTRRFLNNGQLPPVDAVRLEELVNYFSYDDALPEAGEPFAVTREVATCPWNGKHKLVRIGLKGKQISLDQRPLTRLVFLLDTSGSMRSANKLPLVQESMRLLTKQLGENDRIAIVTYAGNAELKLDSTPGDDHDTILAAINSLSAGGSTNGEGGIKAAYEVAKKHFIDDGTNRVILCTDGDFNVGVSDDSELVKLIEERRETGVFLTILGFGMGNIKDAKLEGLADKGNGSYGYIDNIEEATKLFVEELMGTLYTIAKDVKLQIEFNPRYVGAYRLLGYENRLLAAEDFNNDKIDAGELGAGHSVTALYEIIPPDAWNRRPFVDPLRYQPVQPRSQGKKPEDIEVLKLSNRELAERVASTLTAKQFGGHKIELKVQDGVVTMSLSGTEKDEAILQEAEAAILSIPGVRSIRSNLTINGKPIAAQHPDDAPAANGPAGEVTAQEGELLLVKVRYKQPDGETSVKREWPLKEVAGPPSKSMQWASAVVGFGLLLRNSAHREEANWDLVRELADGAKEDARFSPKELERRTEFLKLCDLAKPLWLEAHTPPAPPELVQGTITNVLGKELVEVDLGSTAGIVVGDTLTMLHRGEREEPVWLGTVEIVSVETGKAFAKASITLADTKVTVDQLKGTSVLKVVLPTLGSR